LLQKTDGVKTLVLAMRFNREKENRFFFDVFSGNQGKNHVVVERVTNFVERDNPLWT
jgi:hypothetical protein